jgi:hypothetical protein
MRKVEDIIIKEKYVDPKQKNTLLPKFLAKKAEKYRVADEMNNTKLTTKILKGL